ncbi:hypothetical protein ABH922_002221 [Rhodococcus sp. 27YEA15]
MTQSREATSGETFPPTVVRIGIVHRRLAPHGVDRAEPKILRYLTVRDACSAEAATFFLDTLHGRSGSLAPTSYPVHEATGYPAHTYRELAEHRRIDLSARR